MQQSQAAGTRRNGKRQSCEPCRKSKTRCDHTTPVCLRCSMKGISEQCFYHPAPMTKPRVRVRSASVLGPVITTSSPTHPNTADTGDISNNRQFQAGEDIATTTIQPPIGLPGYLGSTSYSAALGEQRSDIAIRLGSNQLGTSTLAQPLNPESVQSGLKVLDLLYHLTICDTLVHKSYERSRVPALPYIVMEKISTSLRQILDDFDGATKETSLRELSARTFHNSSQPLQCHRTMTVEEYCGLFTGQNIRWEAVGNIFAVSGRSLVATPVNDPVIVPLGGSMQAKDELLTQFSDASNICLSFCDRAVSSNEVLACLQYNDMMLKTQQYGDSSYESWNRLGGLSTTVYATGLHQNNESSEETCPFFLQQWKRGCFACAFYADKCVATFMGRPPLINYRYCALVPPLDLSDDILATGGQALNNAVQDLTPAGWNRHGKIHRTSLARIRFLLAIFREQVLELTLGTYRDDIEHRAKQILEDVQATWDSCPEHLRYDLYSRNDRRAEPSNSSFTIFLAYLDYLYSCFLLNRTLIKHINKGHSELFDTARQLLSTVIKINESRDLVLDLSMDFSWATLYYGLPSANVLALQLLNQTQQSGNSNSRANNTDTVLPRPEIIRNLSVFISCLSWAARPGDGNYQICKDAEKKLSHILDQILDTNPVQSDMWENEFQTATTDLDNLLDWCNYNHWEFNSDLFNL